VEDYTSLKKLINLSFVMVRFYSCLSDRPICHLRIARLGVTDGPMGPNVVGC